MHRHERAMIVVDEQSLQRPLTAAQKKFNQLSKKIAQQKQQLQQWQQTEQEFNQLVYGKLIPAYQQLAKQQFKLALELDHALKIYKLGKVQQHKLMDLICYCCKQAMRHQVLDAQHASEVKELYTQYQQLDDHLTPDSLMPPQSSLYEEDYLDNAGDFLNSHEEEINPALESNPKQHRTKQHRAKQHRTKQQSSKKTAKQQIREQEELAAEELAQKSLKSIYQRLAAQLHPDREPDENEKPRKTALMQQASEAYKQQDLMALLSLQLELQQDARHTMQELADEQLSLYNFNLNKTLQQLNQQIEQITQQLAYQIQRPSSFALKPSDVMKAVKSDLKQQQSDTERVERDLKLFANEAYLKDFLRQYRL